MNVNYGLKITGKSSSLTSTQPGVYEERCWYNDTSNTVVVIDSTNKKLELPPRTNCGFGPKVVRFQRRSGVGPTKSENGVQVLLDYEELTIKESDLLSEPVFIRELNTVICSISMIGSVNHPYSSACYSDIFNKSVEVFETTFKESPGVTFVANDPQKRFSEVFTYMYDCPICIPVTNIVDDTPDATLTCIFTTIDGIYKQVINIEELNEKHTLPINNEIISVVSLSKHGAQQYLRSHKTVTFDEYESEIKRIELINKKEIENIKNQAKVEKETLENKVKTLEMEAEEYKTKYTSLKATVDATVDYRAADYKQEQLRHTTRQAEIKYETERDKHTFNEIESNLKIWHLVLAAALPYIIKGIAPLIKQTAESK